MILIISILTSKCSGNIFGNLNLFRKENERLVLNGREERHDPSSSRSPRTTMHRYVWVCLIPYFPFVFTPSNLSLCLCMCSIKCLWSWLASGYIYIHAQPPYICCQLFNVIFAKRLGEWDNYSFRRKGC